MKKKLHGLVVCMLLTLAIVPVTGTMVSTGQDPTPGDVSRTDWWPMFQHDAQHTGTTTSTTPFTNKTLWTFTTGDIVTGSPVVSDNYVYVGSYNRNFYCLYTNNGSMKWSIHASGEIREEAAAVAYGRVYFSADINMWFSTIYCVNAENGEMIWTYEINDGMYTSRIYGGITVDNGKVYLGTSASHNTFYCLDAYGDGLGSTDVLWSFNTSDDISSTPAVVNDRVYFISDKLYCLNATYGTSIWNYTLSEPSECSPTVIGDRLYVGARDNYVYCFDADPSDGDDEGITDLPGSRYDIIWKYQTGSWVISAPAYVDNKLYVAGFGNWNWPEPPDAGGTAFCFNATTGKVIWTYNTTTTDELFVGAISVADGKVFIASDYGWGIFYCLDANTGKQIWNYTTGSWVASSPAIADGKVYIASSNGKVYCFYDNEITPQLEIELKGGFSQKMILKNVGNADAQNVEWSLSIQGGILGKINVSRTGNISLFPAGAEELVKTPLFGLGRISLTATTWAAGVSPVTKTAKGFVLGFIVIISKGT